jgi:hypothetical protein
MAGVELCKTRDEFRDFINNYEGELRVEGRRAWDGDSLVALVI